MLWRGAGPSLIDTAHEMRANTQQYAEVSRKHRELALRAAARSASGWLGYGAHNRAPFI